MISLADKTSIVDIEVYSRLNKLDLYMSLYSPYAIYLNSAKLCPVGWHVPSFDEWDILLNYLGGDTIAGGKMKEAGTIHWNDPNGGATNESGFTALPGGTYNGDNKYYDMGSAGYYYSSTMNMVRIAGNDMLSFTYFQFRYNSVYAIKGYSTMGSPSHASVRCVKN